MALLAVQGGSSAIAGLSVVAMYFIASYLAALLSAMMTVSKLAATWLRSTPMTLGAFVLALSRRAFVHQLIGTMLAVVLMSLLGTPLAMALDVAALWLGVVVSISGFALVDNYRGRSPAVKIALTVAAFAALAAIVQMRAGRRHERACRFGTRSESMTSILLDVRQVHAKYGKREVLSGISLQVPAGEWFCLLGPNGVGKSTLLRCISGALAPSAGDLLIAGHSVIADPLAAKRRLGYACSPEQLPALLTGRQCLEVYAQAKGLQALDETVLALSSELRFDGYLDSFVDTYSLGTRQKLCILLGPAR